MLESRFSRDSMLRVLSLWLALAPTVIAAPAHAEPSQAPILACATVPELGSLAQAVGGDKVSVTVFAKPTEDPHFVEAKPSFIKAMNQCDLYIQVGLDLEVGWAPLLLENARNARIQPGAAGYVDASVVINPLQVPTTPVSRLLGDVHPAGNPHYLTDPVNGLHVANLLKQRISELRPEFASYFEQRYAQFAHHLAQELVGPRLAEQYGASGAEKLATLYQRGKLEAFLESQGQRTQLSGWLGQMLPHRGAEVVDDHDQWPYFAARFGIEMMGHMEPKPGVPPTTKHLGELVVRMRAANVPVIITSAYYDPRHAQFLASQTDAEVVPLANEAGAQAGTNDYLSMVDYNVRRLASALSASERPGNARPRDDTWSNAASGYQGQSGSLSIARG
jgi:ABC-type Zn uptake system ZnuABC Zn-binding protein ZnuA